jgi:signal transduction histidine kinase
MLYTLSGVPRESFAKFPMPRNTAVFAPTFDGAGIVRSADIREDARYGKSAPHYGMPKGHLPVRSYLAVPVISRSGEVLGGLFFGHEQTGVFTERAERMVASIASQAAIAMDNARLYRAEREAATQLREADRRKDEFLATLAHELRNPLAPIRTGLHLLHISPPGSEPAAQARAMMERQLNHLIRLVDDLLEVSRISTGKIELRRERLELAAAVLSAVETVRPMMEAARHRLDISLPPEPVMLEGDFVRLAQVVANLLSNAAKYTDPGGRVALTMRREGGEALVSVRDSGVGIAPEQLPQLFDMFSQAEGTRHRAQGGLGIGLALAKRLAELHGGRIEARSPGAGQGSEFRVYLPLA